MGGKGGLECTESSRKPQILPDLFQGGPGRIREIVPG